MASNASANTDSTNIAVDHPVVPAVAVDGQAAAVVTDDSKTASATTDKKKRGRAPGSGKPKGTKGGPKSTKPSAPKQPRDEDQLLLSISRPAARRFFKAVPGIKGMRLAENATDPIRRLTSRLMQRMAHAIAAEVLAENGHTIYHVHAQKALKTELPTCPVYH